MCVTKIELLLEAYILHESKHSIEWNKQKYQEEVETNLFSGHFWPKQKFDIWQKKGQF